MLVVFSPSVFLHTEFLHALTVCWADERVAGQKRILTSCVKGGWFSGQQVEYSGCHVTPAGLGSFSCPQLLEADMEDVSVAETGLLKT
jgi:hypothetical protein